MRDFFTGTNLRKDAGRPNILRTLFNIQSGSFDKQRWDTWRKNARVAINSSDLPWNWRPDLGEGNSCGKFFSW
jgi:hypothetical protein